MILEFCDQEKNAMLHGPCMGSKCKSRYENSENHKNVNVGGIKIQGGCARTMPLFARQIKLLKILQTFPLR